MTTTLTPAENVTTSGTIDGFTASAIAPENMHLAMQMFSRNYARPMDAVLRELSVNALDAHIEAGNPDPVKVQLPGPEAPRLTISDQGTGLNVDDVIEVFGNYLESTKRGDAAQIGRYGIGSKSPYAVADQYTVTTVKDGIRSLIIFAKREGGVPRYKIVESVPSDEPNGLSITVPTGYDDYQHWAQAAQRVFYYFDPGTVEVSRTEISHYTEDVVEEFSDENVLITENKDEPAVIKMGPISYRIPFHHNRPSGSIITLDNDALEISHSREQIEDTSSNREILDAAVQRWNQYIKTTVRDTLQKAQSLAEHQRMIENLDPIVCFAGVFGHNANYNDTNYNGTEHGEYLNPVLFHALEKEVLQNTENHRISMMIHEINMVRKSTTFIHTNCQKTRLSQVYLLLEIPAVRVNRDDSGNLDQATTRTINRWRKQNDRPALLLIDEGFDLYPWADAQQMEWITLEQMREQAPAPKKQKASSLAEMTVRTAYDGVIEYNDDIVTANPSEKNIVTQETTMAEVKQSAKSGNPVIAGTKTEFAQHMSGRWHRLSMVPRGIGSRWENKHQYLMRAPDIIRIIKGSRSNERISEILGLPVLSPAQYIANVAAELVDRLTDDQRTALAEHWFAPVVDTTPESLLKKHGLDVLVDLKSLASVYTGQNLASLAEDPRIPHPTLTRTRPLTVELLRKTNHTPSNTLLATVVAADKEKENTP